MLGFGLICVLSTTKKTLRFLSVITQTLFYFVCGFKSNGPHPYLTSCLKQPNLQCYVLCVWLCQSSPLCHTMQTLPNSPPLLRRPGGDDDVDIDFRDVFGGPPKRRSKVVETTGRHSFSEIRRRDVIVDNSALILRDEKPVFGEDPSSIRRRFTADDFFDDIFRVNESSSSSSPQRKIKNEQETFGSSLPGSRILSPARPIPHKVESPPGTSFPAQFRLVLSVWLGSVRFDSIRF